MSSCFFPPLGRLQSVFALLKKWGLTVVLIIVFSFIYNINYKIVYSSGTSMSPTIGDGEIYIVSRKHYNSHPVKRADVVLLRDNKYKEYITKRIIGLPGEKLEIINGNIFIDNKMIKDSFSGIKISHGMSDANEKAFMIPENCVWVIGDLRNDSHYGVYNLDDVVGRVKLLF